MININFSFLSFPISTFRDYSDDKALYVKVEKTHVQSFMYVQIQYYNYQNLRRKLGIVLLPVTYVIT